MLKSHYTIWFNLIQPCKGSNNTRSLSTNLKRISEWTIKRIFRSKIYILNWFQINLYSNFGLIIDQCARITKILKSIMQNTILNCGLTAGSLCTMCTFTISNIIVKVKWYISILFFWIIHIYIWKIKNDDLCFFGKIRLWMLEIESESLLYFLQLP